MTNLVVTPACNLRCRYCFARGPRTEAGADGHVPFDEYCRMLDFLQRSGIGEARLVGGEPTLHPGFPELVDEALRRDLRVVLFSNGLMPESALRHIERSDAGQIVVLINAVYPGHAQERVQLETLRRLGIIATLGFNIDSPAARMDFLIERVVAFGLSPTLRLGIAHPIADGSNRHLHPRDYPAAGARILRLIERASRAGIDVRFDCGFVPCMFPPDSRPQLGAAGDDIGNQCRPVPDVFSGGSAIPCFPLATLWQHEWDGSDAGGLRMRFREDSRPYRTLGLYRACEDCGYRSAGDCAGGCLAAALRRLHPASGINHSLTS